MIFDRPIQEDYWGDPVYFDPQLKEEFENFFDEDEDEDEIPFSEAIPECGNCDSPHPKLDVEDCCIVCGALV